MALEQSTVEELAKLAIDMFNNPETKQAALPLLAKIRPGLSLPELDISDRINKARSEVQEELRAMQEKLARAETETRIRDQRDALVSKGLASRDDIPAIEKMMAEDGNPDYEKAARYYNATKAQSIPTPTQFMRPFDHATTDVGDYFKDSRNALKKSLWDGLQRRS